MKLKITVTVRRRSIRALAKTQKRPVSPTGQRSTGQSSVVVAGRESTSCSRRRQTNEFFENTVPDTRGVLVLQTTYVIRVIVVGVPLVSSFRLGSGNSPDYICNHVDIVDIGDWIFTSF